MGNNLPMSKPIGIYEAKTHFSQIVDDLVNGVMTTVEGKPAKSKTPWEVRATMQELRATKEARTRAGRPGLGV